MFWSACFLYARQNNDIYGYNVSEFSSGVTNLPGFDFTKYYALEICY